MVDKDAIRKMKNGHLANSVRWCERVGRAGNSPYYVELLKERDRRDLEGWDDGAEPKPLAKRFSCVIEIMLDATSVADAEKGLCDVLCATDFNDKFAIMDVNEIVED